MITLFNRERRNTTQLPFDATFSDQRKSRSILTRCIRLAEYWHQKHKNYFQHLPLEDHLLQDIGKTRMDVELDTEELKCKLEAKLKHAKSDKTH